jgi:hypothetical protein
MLSPAQRSLRSRIAAYALHASRDPRETTAKARQSFLAKFEQQVDPEGVLPEAERLRRAACARKAHFALLALKSSKARARKTAKQSAAPTPIRAAMEVADDADIAA